MTKFGKVLAGLRQAQGYSSAYSFYNGRGGRKAFGVAFANYLKMEKGGVLPKASRLKSLLANLGLSLDSPDAKDLLFAYLGDVLGSEDLLAALKRPAAADPAPLSWLMAENAVRQAIGQRTIQLDISQYEALARDPNAYACHVILANTKGGLTKKELASRTRLTPKEVDAAAAGLAAAGLAKLSKDRVESPLAGKYVVPPIPTPALSGIYAKLQAYRREWLRRHGSTVAAPYLLLRAPKGKFSQYLPHLSDVVAMSAVYGDVAPGPESEMYLVEASVTRLFEPRDQK
jgi:transcriptional regulator with XRE-family HTH domain